MNRRVAITIVSLFALPGVAAAFDAQEQGSSRSQPSHSGHASRPANDADSKSMHDHSDDHAAMSAPTASELAHVPPDPPSQPLPEMSQERMVELMQMEDTAPVGMVSIDQLEWRDADAGDGLAWDTYAWYGNDYDKVWLKAEGERLDGETEGRVELLWNHVFARWWSFDAGVRHDYAEGPGRTWAAVGVQGLAPYWFEIEATLYAGEEGRTAARFSAEYELLLTQRWILEPELELNLYGKDDPANGIGSGLSDLELGLRLRYEIRREFAPYIGLAWTRRYGETRDLARTAGDGADDLELVLGLKAWF